VGKEKPLLPAAERKEVEAHDWGDEARREYLLTLEPRQRKMLSFDGEFPGR